MPESPQVLRMIDKKTKSIKIPPLNHYTDFATVSDARSMVRKAAHFQAVKTIVFFQKRVKDDNAY